MKVLIAIQDSKCVEVLGDFVSKFPWPDDASFRVMHIVHPVLVNSYMSLLPSPLTQSIAEERRKEGEANVKALVDVLKVRWNAERVDERIIEGDAKMEIIDQISEWGAELVVLGSHPKTGLMGSVSRAVVSHSACSAIVVPIAQRDKKKTTEKIHIVY